MADHLELAKDYNKPPPARGPYSVPVPGTEQLGRSATYRHWRFRDGLLKSLDPNVGRLIAQCFDKSRLTLLLGHQRPSNV